MAAAAMATQRTGGLCVIVSRLSRCFHVVETQWFEKFPLGSHMPYAIFWSWKGRQSRTSVLPTSVVQVKDSSCLTDFRTSCAVSVFLSQEKAGTVSYCRATTHI